MNKRIVDKWLSVNNITTKEIIAILSANAHFLPTPLTDDDVPAFAGTIDGEGAWALAARAMGAALPSMAQTVRHTGAATRRCLASDHERRDLGRRTRPFTFDNGPGEAPFVRCDYRGSPADMLDVAHEFAHALQIFASDGTEMPPVARETCAFLGEAMLIAWVETHEPQLWRPLEQARRTADARYLGADADALAGVLDRGDPPYDYRWNYPPARLAAAAMLRDGTVDDIEALFRSGERAPEILARFLRAAAVTGLPPLPASTRPSENAYRQVGAIVLLDIQAGGRGGEAPMRERHGRLLACMRSQTAFIALDGAGSPVGYALWSAPADGAAAAEIDLHALPGEEETLRGALQRSPAPRIVRDAAQAHRRHQQGTAP